MTTAPRDRRSTTFRAGGVSVVVDDGASPGLPRILYWGADLGGLFDDAVRELAVVSVDR